MSNKKKTNKKPGVKPRSVQSQFKSMDFNPVGLFRVAAISPKVHVGDPHANAEEILKMIERAEKDRVAIACFPERCLVGATAMDSLFSAELYNAQMDALARIAVQTEHSNMTVILGILQKVPGGIANAAAIMQDGELVDIVSALFNSGNGKMLSGLSSGAAGSPDSRYFKYRNDTPIIFSDPDSIISFAVEVGDDYKEYNSPVRSLALGGTHMIFNPRAQAMIAGGSGMEIADINSFTKKTIGAYIAAGAASGESATYGIYGGHSYISEDGVMLITSPDPENTGDCVQDESYIVADINFKALEYKRSRAALGSDSSVKSLMEDGKLFVSELPLPLRRLYNEDHIDDSFRTYHRNPFLPFGDNEKDKKYAKLMEVFEMQASALANRIAHLNAEKAVIGISGGLDSAAALLVSVRALEKLKRPASDILAVTMPSFGTSNRTYENAIKLIKLLKADFREISIKESISLHFDMIGHDPNVYDLTYENAQARERTQILMDLAGKEGGFVVGTGDMSESALGWCTYGGDHMSMYGVNAGVPKTVLQEMIRWYADAENDCEYCKRGIKGLSEVLISIVDTPVSPELVPDEGISADEKAESPVQKTEDKIGPYELTDFFMYHHFVNGADTNDLLYITARAFAGKYDIGEIEKWMDSFFERVFKSQFKRNCAPDGPAIFEMDLMPHGGLILPSDIKI